MPGTRHSRQCRSNNRVGDIGWAIQQHAEKFGYGIVRDYTGHGIGRTMHEAPQIPNYGRAGTREKIRAGYCFAIEPMLNLGTHETKTLSDKWTVVTLDGKPSAHAEHTLAVTADGPEILTLTKEQKRLCGSKWPKPPPRDLKLRLKRLTLTVCPTNQQVGCDLYV